MKNMRTNTNQIKKASQLRKFIVVLLLTTLTTISFVGCGDTGNSGSNKNTISDLASRDLDFRSIGCTKTGKVASLGDRVAVFEEVFGEGDYMEYGLYSFLGGALEVGFENGRATGLQFNTYPVTDRVEFYDLDLDITVQEAFETLIVPEFARDDGALFNRFFDSHGNEVLERENADYVITVAVFEPNGLMYIVLHQND